MQKTKRFGKDFILVIIGQIISLFGNAVLRFALPLYLFDQTGSPTLLGLVSAGSFLPMVVLSPVGGIVADRVNKRNIMVVLDFSAAALIALFALALGRMPLVPLLMAVLLLLYGIQGAYQPAVQASIPLLAAPEQLMPANAAVNMVSSLASLVGPVLGGVLYSWNGLRPILYVSCACFVFSAVMETFIRIPHASRGDGGSIWRVAQKDMARSLRYIFREKPVVGRIILLVCAFNLFMSSMLIIGLPVILRQTLAVDTLRYGLSQGALAAGGRDSGRGAGGAAGHPACSFPAAWLRTGHPAHGPFAGIGARVCRLCCCCGMQLHADGSLHIVQRADDGLCAEPNARRTGGQGDLLPAGAVHVRAAHRPSHVRRAVRTMPGMARRMRCLRRVGARCPGVSCCVPQPALTYTAGLGDRPPTLCYNAYKDFHIRAERLLGKRVKET